MKLNLKFKYNDHFGIPQCSIKVDDEVLYQGDVKEQLVFDHKLDQGKHTMSITHYGKQNSETTVDQDKHFVLEQIVIDEVDVDQFEHCRLSHTGRFYPDYDEAYVKDQNLLGNMLPEYIQPNHYFGHNGTWVLDFETPTLLWLIKEQNPSGIHLEDTMFKTGQETMSNLRRFFDLD